MIYKAPRSIKNQGVSTSAQWSRSLKVLKTLTLHGWTDAWTDI